MLLAYSFAINPQSKIALKQASLGSDLTRGFSVVSTCEIPKDATIHELIGMMANDGRTPDSDLSAINPHPDSNQSASVRRILFGPARFINHMCKSYNAAVTNNTLLRPYGTANIISVSSSLLKAPQPSTCTLSVTSKQEKKLQYRMAPNFLTKGSVRVWIVEDI